MMPRAMPNADNPFVDRFMAAFAERQSRLPGASVPWIRRLRSEAIERFAELGLPTTRDEDWKYTSVAGIARRAFDVVADASLEGIGERVATHALPGTHRLVFVDGHYVSALSQVGTLPQGAHIGSLALATVASGDRLAEIFGGGNAADGFGALNEALWSDGAWIDVAPGVVVEEPVHLLFVTTRSDAASFSHNLMQVGDGASVTVIEQHVGPEEASYLTDAVTRIVVGKAARVNHTKLQQEGRKGFHIARVAAEQARDSRFCSHAFAFGAQLARSEIAVRLGEGCDTELVGLYVGDGRSHVDHHTFIDHAAPRGRSRELYKGVLDGSARAVFNGRVIVRPDAQGTDAQQTNRNLLLSDDAEVDTKPQLEIWADDVKCAHGATVGQLDEDQLYYLRSRGIGEADARGLLIRAFALEALGSVAFDPLRARLEALLPGRSAQAT